ncbi:helix-turn-helix transcriptional regulator [Alteromonas stellipolaris]|uniref:HTH cro/C1-type domain-containing protein n=1 Tax=Alteromonas stellipolaris TaxID=233316 RepID=A0ABN4LRZ0_9ALTE|nr:hypothetical protein AVL57_00405 [Alteromonas stellipolaris]
MNVKRLRIENGWSQEHLSKISGVSVRTIQRVENGHSSSLETRSALAAVFELDSSIIASGQTLDKESQKWKKQPLLVRLAYWGVKSRESLIRVELIAAFFGLATWIIGPDTLATPSLFIIAYGVSLSIRHADSKGLW